jgi:PAS domain S-box-containing protein
MPTSSKPPNASTATLRRRLLLPLVIGGLAMAFVGARLAGDIATPHAQSLAERRADAIVTAVRVFADAALNRAELQRCVSSCGVVDDVRVLAVVGGRPLRVVAASDRSWLGAAPDVLAGSLTLDPTRLATQATRGRTLHERVASGSDTSLVVAAPFEDGAVLLRLDLGASERMLADLASVFGAFIALVVAALTLTAGLLLRRHVIDPAEALRATMGRRAAGEATARVPNPSADEIGDVGRTLNAMLDVLTDHEDQMRNWMRHLPAVAFRCSPDGRFHFASTAIESLTGYPIDAFLEGRIGLRDLVHADDLRWLRATVDAATAEPYEMEYRMVRADGTLRTVLERGQIRLDRDGNEVRDGFLVDVSARSLAERAVHAAEARLRMFLDVIPDLIFRVRGDGIVLDYKAPSDDDLAVPPEQFLGKSMHEFLPADLADRLQTALDDCLRLGQMRVVTYTLGKRGVPTEFETRIVPAGPDQALVIAADVSERHRAQAAIRAAKEHAEQLLAELTSHQKAIDDHAIVTVTDAEGRIVHANDRFCEISGYARHELIGRTHAVVNSRTHSGAFFADLWRTISRGDVWRGEVCNRAKDGRLFWLEMTVAPFRDTTGRIVKHIAIRTDITVRKMIEARMSATNARLQAILDAASEVAIIACDLRGVITTFNPGAERMLGWREEEVVGIRSPECLHDAAELRARAAALSVELGRPVEGFETFVAIPRRDGSEKREWTYVRKNGTRLTVQLVVTPQRDTDGAICGYLGLAMDVSDQRRTTTELRETNEALVVSLSMQSRMSAELEASRRIAEAASRSKSEFLANMSHEIRTPMTAILGYTEILRGDGGQLSPTQRDEAIETIQRNGSHLLAILNDILDLSKIEAGRMTVERIDCGPVRLASDVVAMMQPRALGKGLALTLDVATPIPRTIQTDPTRLRQILVNLVGNAIKFTERGSVRLTLSVDGVCGDGRPQLRMAIADTGIGMSPHQVERLFQAFSQADASTTRRFGGTGLGLSICKRLAQLLDGDITVSSTPGSGSTFVVCLPVVVGSDAVVDPAGAPLAAAAGATKSPGERAAPADATGAAATARPQPLTGMRVLLAEDGPDNQRLISFHLRRAGAEVALVGNGRDAVDTALGAVRAGQPFDLVLMDMQMPVLDGYGAARELRDQGYPGGIVALTAHAMAGDRERCVAAGCNDYTTKPIARDTLIAACAEWKK